VATTAMANADVAQATRRDQAVVVPLRVHEEER
jgi:hypothetical protein